MIKIKNKFEIQDNQYVFPYHHLLNLNKYKFYDYISWGLEYYSYVSYVVDYINQEIKKGNIKKIAEVGCGDGKLIIDLAQRNKNLFFDGFDLSKQAILFSKSFSYNLKNIKFFDTDFKNSKNKYDLIFCVETLEHIPNDKLSNFLLEINKKLRDNGILIITVPTTNVKLHPKHYRHYDLNLLKKQTSNLFSVKNHKYIYNKNSIRVKLIRSLLSNKIIILNIPTIRKYLIKKYDRLKLTNKKNGTHLFAVLKKK